MRSAVREWYESMTDVRRDELLPVVLLFVYGLFALTSYYVLKPARNSIFVDRVGADNLPYVYILTAVVVAVVMLGYSRYVDRLRHVTLLLGTFAFLASNLLFFWWVLGSDSLVVSGAFYVWGKLYPLLLVSQFWLVGNLLFTTRQARRLFGVVGLGPIIGGVAGSAIAGGMATLVGTRTLVLMSAAFLVPCAAIVLLLAPRMRRGRAASGRLMENLSGDAIRLLRDSSHLRTIAAILFLTIVVGTLIDWQFNKAVDLSIAGEDQKTAFFGGFFATLNVASVLVQLFLTGFVLRKFGIGLAMLALPVGLLVASAGVFLAPVLLTAALVKGTEGGIRYSLDQSTRELLYLPVPTAVKYKVKPLIDLAVYRGGTGFGGLLLLLTTRQLGFSIRHVAVLCVVLIGGWVLVTLRMRREFRVSIKRLIGVRDVDLKELVVGRLNAETLAELRDTLRRGSEQEVLYALALLEGYASDRFCDELRPLLFHESAAVRARALTRLFEIGDTDSLPAVLELLKDPSLLVRVEAIHFVCRYGVQSAEVRMSEFLEDPDSSVRLAALACPLHFEDSTQWERAEQALREAAASQEPDVRRAAARELTQLEELPAGLRALLAALLRDPDEVVRREATRAVGRTQSREFIALLASRLCCRDHRTMAREGLERFGPEAHPDIVALLRDPRTPERVRLELPAALYPRADARSADLLFELLPDVPPPVRFRILKTLNKLRRDREDLDFRRYQIGPLVRREVMEGYRWAAREHVLGNGALRPGSLLVASLAQRRDEAAERAFRVLGLHYSLPDLHAAWAGLQSPEKIMQERGFELLDNILPRAYRQLFDPLVSPDESSAARARAAARYGIRVAGVEETLRDLAGGEDRWTGVLARFELGLGWPTSNPLPEPPFHGHDLAELLLGPAEAESPIQGEESRMASTIEKAELLRRTELFGGLRARDQAIVAALADEREFPEGHVIYREGEPSSELFIVAEGRIHARQGDRVLFTAEAGQTVGDLALLDGLPRDYDAVVVEPVRALSLDREAFLNLLRERFQVVSDVLAHITGVVRKMNKEYHLERPCG